MKKLFYYASIGSIMLLLAVIVQSCKQDIATQPTPTVDNVTVTPVAALKLDNVNVIDGRLAFKSEADWQAALDKIFKNQNSLNGLEAQFKGFTSQKQAQDNFTEADMIKTNGDLTPYQDFMVKNVRDGEIFFDGVVQSKLYAQLVNSEGLVQAGDKVYKFTPGFLYEFNVNDMASYRANKNNLIAITNVQKIDLNESKKRMQATPREDFFASGQVTDPYERQPADTGPLYRRTDAYLCSDGPGSFIFSSAEVRLEHRIRGAFGAWYKEKTELKFSGTVTLGTLFGGVITKLPLKPVNSFEPNSADASNVLERCNCQFDFVYFNPTNVNYTAIRQTRPVSRSNTSNLNITF
jgi:hypothetical protein